MLLSGSSRRNRWIFVLLLLAAWPASDAAAAAAAAAAIRIAVGAKAPFVSNDGSRWIPAGTGFEGGTVTRWSQAITTRRDPRVYQGSRVGVRSYTVSVPDGWYTVRLHFVENDPAVTEAEQRVFALDIEGNRVADIDIWDNAFGHRVPFVQASRVRVADKSLDIRFLPVKGEPVVSAIEVIPDAPARKAPAPAAATIVEDWSRFATQDEAIAKAFVTDDLSGAIEAHAAPDAPQGPGKMGPGVRLDYRIHSILPYSVEAHAKVKLSADLTGKHSLRVWVRPDGSDRLAVLRLHDAEKHAAAYGFRLTGTEPRQLVFSLDHTKSGDWWYASDTDPAFAKPIVALSISIKVDAPSTLGGGFLELGPIAVTDEITALTQPPPGTRMKATPGRLLVDDFEGAEKDEDLFFRYESTLHGSPAVFHLDRSVKNSGSKSLRVDYTFDKKDYSGFVLFKDMDLRPYNMLRMWVKPDGRGNPLGIFLASKGFYYTQVSLAGTAPHLVEVPFADFIGNKAELKGNLEWGFWIQRVGDSPGGSINIDDIEFVFDPSKPSQPILPPTPVSLPGDRITRIDVGAYDDWVDDNGNLWLSDRGYHWGRPRPLRKWEHPERYPASPIRNVFLSSRYGMTGYGFAVPNGKYTVKLHYGEQWLAALSKGRRLCGLKVNGARQPDVDIFDEAGGRFRYMARSIPVDVKDGLIDIEFWNIAVQCKLDALEIIPALARK